VAGVAHELNNPLQAVMGYTELLLRDETRQSVRQDLEQVQADAGRAAAIVRNLVTFVRRSALERTLVDLGEVTRSTLALKVFDLQKAQITVQEAYTPDPVIVAGNREELRQAILNLVSNAEQAIAGLGRSGVISVRTGSSDGCGFVEVSDNGPGVPAAMAGRIFEPFFTTRTVGQGTGLGLSIGLGIAQAHGGTLALVPTDRGACFLLSVPLASETMRPSTAALVNSAAEGPGTAGGGVEDDAA